MKGRGSKQGSCQTIVSDACVAGFYGAAGSEVDSLGALYIDKSLCEE
ncbi:hypothetical protein [uncultured Shewanella sp.]|nr:hypothetical protein [uncultured Shewanella sp.]